MKVNLVGGMIGGVVGSLIGVVALMVWVAIEDRLYIRRHETHA